MWIEVALVQVFSLFLLGLATWLAGQSLPTLFRHLTVLAVDPALLTRSNDLTASKFRLVDGTCLIGCCSLWFRAL
jgi:hypothetical protein